MVLCKNTSMLGKLWLSFQPIVSALVGLDLMLIDHNDRKAIALPLCLILIVRL